MQRWWYGQYGIAERHSYQPRGKIDVGDKLPIPVKTLLAIPRVTSFLILLVQIGLLIIYLFYTLHKRLN